MNVKPLIAFPLSISILLSACATGPNPSENDIGEARTPFAPEPVCGPAHRFEPPWIPSQMNNVNNGARPHWTNKVMPSKGPEGKEH